MILAGFQQLVFNHSLGGTYNQPVHGVIFHTTEGTTVQGAVSVYKTIQAAPHLTVDPETFERFQHVPLDRSAYALRNLQGGCETNTAGVIQIELVGRASETWSWSSERLQWVGTEVLRPILLAYPDIPHTVYRGPRMDCQQWQTWTGGLAGHAAVPENDHWDPGDLDLETILNFALPPPPKKDDMPEYILRDATDASHPWIAVYPNGNLRHIGGDEAGHIIASVGDIAIIDERDINSYRRAVSQAGSTV